MPVVDQERRGEAEQRLHGRERHLAFAGRRDAAAVQQGTELLAGLADRQVQVVREVRHKW